MLTAASIIGKVVLFIVEKAGSQIIAMQFDKRRKACRSISKLYNCVQALDEITQLTIDDFQIYKNSGNAHPIFTAISSNAHHIEVVSNVFIETGYDLYEALEVIDPALAQCCTALCVGKYDLLTFLSNSIVCDYSSEPATILIKRPLGRMESADLDAMYRDTSGALRAGEKYYWPTSAFDDFNRDFEDVIINFEDERAATEIFEMIVSQNGVLGDAREKLRLLIKSNFTIDEILYSSNKKISLAE